MKNLDKLLGELGRWIAQHPTIGLICFLIFVFLVTMPRAHAALSITICGSATYTCPSDLLADSPTGGGWKVGDTVYGVKVNDGTDSALIPTSPNTPLPTPAGWSGPNSPPASAGSPVLTYSVSGVTGASAEAACAAWVDSMALGMTSVVSSTTGHCQGWLAGVYNGFDSGITTIESCPTGYEVSGGSCLLVSALTVAKPSDSAAAAVRSGNVITFDPNDPDANTGSPSSSASKLFVGGSGTSTISAGAVNVGGSVSVAVGGDGKTTITATRDNGDGTSKQTVIALGAPGGDGTTKIEGASSGTVQGSGTLAGSGNPVPTTTTAKDPCGLPGTSPCKLDETGTPNGSSVTGAADALGASMDSMKDSLTTDAAQGGLSALGVPVFVAPSDDTKPDISAFAGSDDCTDIDATIPMPWQTYAVTLPVCQVIRPAKLIFAWVLSMGAVLYAWGRLTGRIGYGV